jgi:WD40 repeat protein
MEDNKHLDIVWEIDWARKSQKAGCSEQLISISSDGKVNEWNIKKGLECNELKLIAHQQNPLFKSKCN